MTDKPLVISERSWHYRLYMKSGPTPPPMPKTLCGYFWLVVLAPVGIFTNYLLKWTVFAVVDRILRLGDVPAAIILSAVLSSALTVWGLFDWESLLIVLGGIAGGSAVIFLLALLAFAIADRWKKDEERPASSARLVLATLQAKKRRICPLIEVRP